MPLPLGQFGVPETVVNTTGPETDTGPIESNWWDKFVDWYSKKESGLDTKLRAQPGFTDTYPLAKKEAPKDFSRPSVPYQPEVTPITEGAQDRNDAAVGWNAYVDALRTDFGTGGRLTAVPMPGYEEWPAAGGANGRALFEDTYITRPERMAQTAEKIGDIQANQAEETAEWMKGEHGRQMSENAMAQTRRAERAQEFQARQKMMDAAVERYSNDLSDRGKFWANPGSVLSSIGAAMIAGASPGDRGIGVRIIQQAINSDFEQRKAAADMHLGALRSNLQQYREFMGDQNAGDAYALAEANRVAALELQRIGQQFQGPLMREKAKMISEELMVKSNEGRMRAYNMAIYKAPHMIDPRIKKEYEAMNAAMAPNGPAALKGSFAPGMTGQAAPQNMTKELPPKWLAQEMGDTDTVKKYSSAEESKVSPQAKALANVGMKNVDAAIKGSGFIDARAPMMSQNMKMWKQEIAQETLRLLGPHASRDAFNKKNEEIIQADINKAMDVAGRETTQKAAAGVKLWSSFHDDLAKFAAASKAMGKDSPEDLLSDLRRGQMGEYDNFISSWKLAHKGKNLSPEERRQLDELEAVQRLYQTVNTKTVEYYNKYAGSALSKQEIENLRKVISEGGTFASWLSFSDDQLSRVNGERDSALAGTTPRQRGMIEMNLGIKSPKGNTQGQKSGKPN